MSGSGTAGDEPDLVAEARFWREWNTAVFERDHSREEAERIAATLSPDPERLEALLSRARATHALRQSPAALGDDVLVQIHADAGRFFQSRLAQSWVPGYLTERGLDAVLLPTSPWKVGYAPDSWTDLTNHLRSLGYSDDTLLRSGLVCQADSGHVYDRFRNRLMIPLRRADDRVVIAFAGRRALEATDDDGPKYLNSPNTDLYVKGRTLPGLAEGRRALDHGARPVLVEGLTDAMAVSIAAPGTCVGVTACGTALTSEQAALLARTVNLRESGLRIALDADGAGSKAAVRAYAPLSQVTSEITTVTLSEKDPAKLLQHHGRQALKDALTSGTRPLADLVVNAKVEAWQRNGRLESVEAQFGAIRAVGKLIATMPPAEAAEQATRIATLFIRDYGWSPEDANRELIEVVERHVSAASEETRPIRGTVGDELPPQTTDAVRSATAPVKAIASSHQVMCQRYRTASANRAQPGHAQRGD